MTPLEFAVAILLFGLAAALFFIQRLSSRLTALEHRLPIETPIGKPLAEFEGVLTADGRTIRAPDLFGQTTVMVLLSSGCPKCASKREDLLAMLPGMAHAGVAFYIVPADPMHGISEIVDGSPLANRVLRIRPAALLRLNPNTLTPAYLFIDENGIVRDHSHMDDENWVGFVSQMSKGVQDEP